MTMLAGLGIGATGLVVVFGALTGRLAAMLAAVVRPTDLAGPGTHVNGVSDVGNQAGNTADQNQNLLTALVGQIHRYGADKDPDWPRVEALVKKASKTKSDSDYQAAITALRALRQPYLDKYNRDHAGTGGGH